MSDVGLFAKYIRAMDKLTFEGTESSQKVREYLKERKAELSEFDDKVMDLVLKDDIDSALALLEERKVIIDISKPKFILDENIPKQLLDEIGWSYERVAQELQHLLFNAGIETTYVGDEKKYPGLGSERMWFKDYSRKEKIDNLKRCDVHCGDNDSCFKHCVRRKFFLQDKSPKPIGRSQVPLRGTSDDEIRMFAEENGMFVISFDADPELEGGVVGDRILIDLKSICCGEDFCVRGPECGEPEFEINQMADFIVSRIKDIQGKICNV